MFFFFFFHRCQCLKKHLQPTAVLSDLTWEADLFLSSVQKAADKMPLLLSARALSQSCLLFSSVYRLWQLFWRTGKCPSQVLACRLTGRRKATSQQSQQLLFCAGEFPKPHEHSCTALIYWNGVFKSNNVKSRLFLVSQQGISEFLSTSTRKDEGKK